MDMQTANARPRRLPAKESSASPACPIVLVATAAILPSHSQHELWDRRRTLGCAGFGGILNLGLLCNRPFQGSKDSDCCKLLHTRQGLIGLLLGLRYLGSVAAPRRIQSLAIDY